MIDFTIESGATVTDKITGFEGIVTARCQYMTGCNQYLVQPRCQSEKSEIPAGKWIDQDRLKVKKVKRVVIKTNRAKGGPRDNTPPSK